MLEVDEQILGAARSRLGAVLQASGLPKQGVVGPAPSSAVDQGLARQQVQAAAAQQKAEAAARELQRQSAELSRRESALSSNSFPEGGSSTGCKGNRAEKRAARSKEFFQKAKAKKNQCSGNWAKGSKPGNKGKQN